jgi:two-component system, NtrC family, sensor histidine kinase HydH
MDFTEFQSVAEYVGFTDDSGRVLAGFHPIARPHLGPTIDDFYATIEAHPRAREVITGGPEQIERLKQSLVRWLDSVLLGPHDAAFVEAHSRIGRVHVRIGLPQEFMFTAMNRIRSHLVEVADDALRSDPARHSAVAAAVNQILDLELAIMLDTYRLNLENRMRAQERLATIGQLAASIGHELRNPLSIIESSLFLVRQRLGRASFEDAGVEKHLAKIENQIRMCGKTITDLLELARSRPPQRRPVDVDALISAAAEAAALESGVEVVREVPSDLKVKVDPDQLRQVMSNLMTNASQAMSGSGRIWVTAERQPGGVALKVQDEGPGVSTEHADRIFDALYTTRPKGTGLGLALCRRIIEAHQGEIALEPSERGACFRVFIPDVEGPGDSVRPA